MEHPQKMLPDFSVTNLLFLLLHTRNGEFITEQKGKTWYTAAR